MGNTEIISWFLTRYFLYNEKREQHGHNTIYSYGASPQLNGTLSFKCMKSQGVMFSCKVITDESMYDEILLLAKKYKDSEINLFKPIPLFYDSYGANGLVNISLRVEENNFNDIETIFKMLEVTEKVIIMYVEFDQEYKPLPMDERYLLFRDGRVYSTITNKFISPRKQKKRSSNKFYYSIMLGNRKSYLITRLVMFVYGVHRYKNIVDMPSIIQLDNNTLNFHINNLKFASQRDINLYHGVKPNNVIDSDGFQKNIKIPKSEIEIITFLYCKGKSLEVIGKMYNVSGMSVHRFIKRHNIKKEE